MCNFMIEESKTLPATKMLEVFKEQFEETSFPKLTKKFNS